jgi:hypothetical protein
LISVEYIRTRINTEIQNICVCVRGITVLRAGCTCTYVWFLHVEALFTSPVFSSPKNVGIWCSPNTPKSPQILFPKNTLLSWRVFNLAKNTLEWRGFVGISRDHPLKTRTSKQPIEEVLGYEIIISHPLKYPRSKQGLTDLRCAFISTSCSQLLR